MDWDSNRNLPSNLLSHQVLCPSLPSRCGLLSEEEWPDISFESLGTSLSEPEQHLEAFHKVISGFAVGCVGMIYLLLALSASYIAWLF